MRRKRHCIIVCCWPAIGKEMLSTTKCTYNCGFSFVGAIGIHRSRKNRLQFLTMHKLLGLVASTAFAAAVSAAPACVTQTFASAVPTSTALAFQAYSYCGACSVISQNLLATSKLTLKTYRRSSDCKCVYRGMSAVYSFACAFF